MITTLVSRSEQIILGSKQQMIIDATWFMLERDYERVYKIMRSSQQSVDNGDVLVFLYRHIYGGGDELKPSRCSTLKRLRRKVLEDDYGTNDYFRKSNFKEEYELAVRKACAQFNIDQGGNT